VGLDDPLRSLPTLIFYGLEQGHVKKALLNVEWNICQDCKTDNQRQDKSEEEADESPSIWLCLKCGHRGCGRNSQEQHALKHYTTPRSEPHCLATVKSHNWKKIKTGVPNIFLFCISVSKDQENKEFENKKVEKENQNEQEKEKKEGVIKEDNSSNTSEAVTVKGLSNLGNTCFFNAVMQCNNNLIHRYSDTMVFISISQSAFQKGSKHYYPHFITEPQM
uniref:UBP-type domain-containing protein n=1 Tax=Terrapene triunguis TaxID=2587831 RepID=A0A674K3H0_9SAUR